MALPPIRPTPTPHQEEVHKITGGLGHNMTPKEAEDYMEMGPDAMRESLRQINNMPEDRAIKVLAQMGAPHREWYQKAKQSLDQRFGKEAPRFIALLAATSPQKSVKDNMRTASAIWDRYKHETRNGQLINNVLIDKIIRLARQDFDFRGKGYSFTNSSEYNNIRRALDPKSNPGDTFNKLLAEDKSHKIDNFRRNLLGDMMAVTNDAWIHEMMGNKGQKYPGNKGQGYHPFSAKIRRVADTMGWSPAEVQAAMWQAGRQIAIISNRDKYIEPSSSEPVIDPKTGQQALNKLGRPKTKRTWNRVKPEELTKILNSITTKDISSGAGFHGLWKDPIVQGHLGQYEEPSVEKGDPDHTPIYRDLPVRDKHAVRPLTGVSMAGMMANKIVSPSIVNQGAKKGTKVRFARTDGSQAPPAPTQAPANAPGQPIPPQAGPAPTSAVAASQNVQDGLSYEQASSRSRSGNQSAFKKIMQGMMEKMGLKSKVQDAVGDWQDGAENFVYQEIPHPADPNKVEYAAAWYGLLANQKAVLVFHSSPQGPDSFYQIQFPENNVELRDVNNVRKVLDKYGINFRTIIPGKGGKSPTVTFYDQGRKDREKLLKLVGATHGTVSESSGQGKYIGGPTRTGARAEYRRIIDAYEGGEASGSSGSEHKEESEALLGNNGGKATPIAKPETGDYAFSKRSKRVRFSGVQSPMGGVIVRGMYYPGGKYIPKHELEKAHWNQYQEVAQRRKALYEKPVQYSRRPDGSIPTADKLSPPPQEEPDTNHEVKSLAELMYIMLAKSVTHPNGKTEKIQPTRYAKKIPGSSAKPVENKSYESALEEGGLPRPPVTKAKDYAGKPSKKPKMANRRPKYPYGGYQAPEDPEVEQIEPEEPLTAEAYTPRSMKNLPEAHPIQPQSDRKLNHFGVFQDYMDDFSREIASGSKEHQKKAGAILLSAVHQEPITSADPDLWTAADQAIHSESPEHHSIILPSKGLSKKEEANLYNSWWAANRMEQYAESTRNTKLWEDWHKKAEVLHRIVGLYKLGESVDITQDHTDQDRLVTKANHLFHLLRTMPYATQPIGAKDPREPIKEQLRHMGFPV